MAKLHYTLKQTAYSLKQTTNGILLPMPEHGWRGLDALFAERARICSEWLYAIRYAIWFMLWERWMPVMRPKGWKSSRKVNTEYLSEPCIRESHQM